MDNLATSLDKECFDYLCEMIKKAFGFTPAEDAFEETVIMDCHLVDGHPQYVKADINGIWYACDGITLEYHDDNRTVTFNVR